MRVRCYYYTTVNNVVYMCVRGDDENNPFQRPVRARGRLIRNRLKRFSYPRDKRERKEVRKKNKNRAYCYLPRFSRLFMRYTRIRGGGSRLHLSVYARALV